MVIVAILLMIALFCTGHWIGGTIGAFVIGFYIFGQFEYRKRHGKYDGHPW